MLMRVRGLYKVLLLFRFRSPSRTRTRTRTRMPGRPGSTGGREVRVRYFLRPSGPVPLPWGSPPACRVGVQGGTEPVGLGDREVLPVKPSSHLMVSDIGAMSSACEAGVGIAQIIQLGFEASAGGRPVDRPISGLAGRTVPALHPLPFVPAQSRQGSDVYRIHGRSPVET
jgi:hypothetical protein